VDEIGDLGAGDEVSSKIQAHGKNFYQPQIKQLMRMVLSKIWNTLVNELANFST